MTGKCFAVFSFSIKSAKVPGNPASVAMVVGAEAQYVRTSQWTSALSNMEWTDRSTLTCGWPGGAMLRGSMEASRPTLRAIA
jgi:hypothetical protein